MIENKGKMSFNLTPSLFTHSTTVHKLIVPLATFNLVRTHESIIQCNGWIVEKTINGFDKNGIKYTMEMLISNR